MSSWKHPTIGSIEPLPPGLRPSKVWKHFYDRAEHWERICGRDVASMRLDAEAVVGIQREGREALPSMDRARRDRARDLLRRHHDAAYAPTYQAEMSSPDALWTPSQDARRRHQVLTPNAVFAVVQVDGWNWVVTAFRPLPPTRGVDWDEAAIRRYAVWYFQKETGMHANNLARATAANLQRASGEVPRAAQDLWWLASAIGYGRLLVQHDEVAKALIAAEAVLGDAPEGLVAELAGALDWDGCLRRLAGALKDSGPEETEAALATAEELLSVATAIDAVGPANAFCAEAVTLLAWLPAAWSHLLDHAASRREALGESDHVVSRLWSAVEEAAVGAAMRELTPVERPAATLTDDLIAAQPPWARWRARVAAVSQRASAAIAEWGRASLDSVRARRVVPAMGGEGRPPRSWDVLGRSAPGAPRFRLFAVDEANPEGLEVSGHFDPADGALWAMNPSESAVLIVLVASSEPISASDLASVLAEAASRDDVFVAAKELNRPK